MALVVKPTNEQLEVRRKALADYLYENMDRRIMPTNQDIIAHMGKSFPHYDRHQLYKDRKALAQADTFVSELSITSYSAFLREIWDKIEVVEREAFKDFDNSSGFVRINAKKLILEAQKLRSDLISTNINLSVEKLGKAMRKLEEENKKLKEERILKSKSSKT